MNADISAVWQRLPADWDVQLNERLCAGCEKADAGQPVRVFFRADDVAVPGVNFNRMMGLFAGYGAPLSLAVVPAWLTPERWNYLRAFEKKCVPARWCWHQHGWRHANHEVGGKKQEFGDARSTAQISRDLLRGKLRLEQIMAEAFYPAFTPPWNRCSAATLQSLKKLGYTAVSRSRGSKPVSPRGLPDYYVNVDLHTRRERAPSSGWQNLMGELEQAAASRFCGIMIHHQLMNAAAFEFLDKLLKALISHSGFRLLNFRDLVEHGA